MSALYHRLPAVLVTQGTESVEYRFTETSSDKPDLVITSRIGREGELVRRAYACSPEGVSVVLRYPGNFLKRLHQLLRFQNFDKDQNLWVETLELRQHDDTTLVYHDSELSEIEKYLHEMNDPKLLHLDITPREDQ